MLQILDIAILASLIKLLVEIERPLVPACIYGVYRLGLGGLGGAGLAATLVSGVICFVVVFLWFSVLARVEPLSGSWWAVVVVGTCAGFFIGVV
jgi:hypothetical protein